MSRWTSRPADDTEISAPADALFVEGPDDGALVNALVWRHRGIELGRRPWLVRTNDAGGGADWAREECARYVGEAPPGARIGLIVDRDGVDERPNQWPKVRNLLGRLGKHIEDPCRTG